MAKLGDKPSNWGSLGGSGKMHSFGAVGRQAPGGSAVAGSGGSRRGIAPMAGPTGQGYSKPGTNESFAGTQTPGQSAASPTGARNDFAKGGTTKMFGPSGSRPSRGGQTSQ